MSIKIIVDSGSDILPDEAEKLGIVHIPMTVSFGNEEYQDGVTLSHRGFYEKLIESDVLPTTSQVNPAAFEEVFEKLVSEGHEIIVITISGKLSGTYQSACIAADEFPGKVFVVDSENVCLAERILAERALEYINDNLSIKEIVDKLNEDKKNVRILALLDTLEYLKKGGRISAAVAFAGNLLSIKPVVAAVDGEVALLGKARGSKQGNNLLRELIEKEGGIDFDKPLCLGYSGLSDSLIQKYIEDSSDIWASETESLRVKTIGCTIGTHVGPGAIAIAFFKK